MSLTEKQLEELAEQEAQFFAGVSHVVEDACGIFLFNSSFPEYGNANRVLRLRDDGRGTEAIADKVWGFYRRRDLFPSADLDRVAEAQGIGSALRRRGLNSAITNRLLMRYDLEIPPQLSSAFPVKRIPYEFGSDEARDWLDVSLSHENDMEEAARWRDILRCDLREPSHQLYIAYKETIPASCCQLFSDNGYGRIDDVITRPEYRGRGLASAVIAHAVAVSKSDGNHTTFLYCDAGSAAERLYRKLGFIAWERNPFRRHFAPAP